MGKFLNGKIITHGGKKTRAFYQHKNVSKLLLTCVAAVIIVGVTGLVFTGCSCKTPEPEKVYVPKDVYIPVKPERPDVVCEFNRSIVDVPDALMSCITKYKKALNSVTKEK